MEDAVEGNRPGPESADAHPQGEQHGAPRRGVKDLFGRRARSREAPRETSGQAEEQANERFKGDFEKYVRLVREGDLTEDQAAQKMGMPPRMFKAFLKVDTNLTGFDQLDAGEREVRIKQSVEDSANVPSGELETFLNIMGYGDRDERGEIVASVRVREASRPEIDKEEPTPEVQAELRRDLEEADRIGRQIKDTYAQKAAGWVDDKVLTPIQDWLKEKQHHLDQWIHAPGKVWLKRGFTFLVALLKYTVYLFAWASTVANKMSGKGGKGGH